MPLFRAASMGSVKEKSFQPSPRFSNRMKAALAVVIIAIILVSAFVYLSIPSQSKPSIIPSYNATATPDPTNNITLSPSATPIPSSDTSNSPSPTPAPVSTPPPGSNPPGVIDQAPTINSSTWRSIANNAWQYFQPGIGVDSTTGLPGAGLGWPYFTDWDLGVYIQAIIDAQKTGLIGVDGDWGSHARLEKVLIFLETRELNPTTHYPYWFYQAGDGKNYHALSDTSKIPVDGVDTGRLLIALNNVKRSDPSWATRIDNFVYNRFGNRSNYAAIVPEVVNDVASSTSIYTYYVASGYASFWSTQVNPNNVLDNMLKSGNVKPYGVTLPKGSISCDPLLNSFFELNSNSKLTSLLDQVYSAHEAYYSATGQFVAFSEGNSPTGFIYEWVVLGDQTWKVTDINLQPLTIDPIIYNKVALSFLSIYNSGYAKDVSIYLERAFPAPTKGYQDGVTFATDPNARQYAGGVGSNTNGLILEAARYALSK